MRDVPEPQLAEWIPPSYTVDERGKVLGARPGEPNNWGRWGDDDQRGTANLLTAAPVQASDDYLVMALQAATQLDGLPHVGADHVLYNGYWAGLVTATTGARRLGIHHLADGVVGRAVLLDVARHVGVDALDPGFAIGADLLDATAAAQQ